jgi:hypothetical protein
MKKSMNVFFFVITLLLPLLFTLFVDYIKPKWDSSWMGGLMNKNGEYYLYDEEGKLMKDENREYRIDENKTELMKKYNKDLYSSRILLMIMGFIFGLLIVLWIFVVKNRGLKNILIFCSSYIMVVGISEGFIALIKDLSALAPIIFLVFVTIVFLIIYYIYDHNKYKKVE